ncbi:hypothetical protein HDU91_005084 [Kappamyces sp. JEL0680]|nr:hypothetical protein HDU91_005084 [Kappamyces sp. JEL0680]
MSFSKLLLAVFAITTLATPLTNPNDRLCIANAGARFSQCLRDCGALDSDRLTNCRFSCQKTENNELQQCLRQRFVS